MYVIFSSFLWIFNYSLYIVSYSCAKVLLDVGAANITVVSHPRVVATELTELLLRPIGIGVAFVSGFKVESCAILSLFLHPGRFVVAARDASLFFVFFVLFVVVTIRFRNADGIRTVARTRRVGTSATIAGCVAFGPKRDAVSFRAIGKPHSVAGRGTVVVVLIRQAILVIVRVTAFRNRRRRFDRCRCRRCALGPRTLILLPEAFLLVEGKAFLIFRAEYGTASTTFFVNERSRRSNRSGRGWENAVDGTDFTDRGVLERDVSIRKVLAHVLRR